MPPVRVSASWDGRNRPHGRRSPLRAGPDAPESFGPPERPVSARMALAKRQLGEFFASRGGCEACGSSGSPGNPLEAAHLRPTGLHGPGRGQKKRVRDIRAHPESYASLCRACHREFDRRGLGPKADRLGVGM